MAGGKKNFDHTGLASAIAFEQTSPTTRWPERVIKISASPPLKVNISAVRLAVAMVIREDFLSAMYSPYQGCIPVGWWDCFVQYIYRLWMRRSGGDCAGKRKLITAKLEFAITLEEYSPPALL
jgi:hypothetical protein